MKNTEENEKGEDTLEKPKFNISKILIIDIIIVVVAIAVIIILWLVLREKTNGGDVSFPAGVSLEEKLKLCLEKEEFDNTCLKFFLNSEIYRECENLEKLRDKCLYYTAILNGKNYLCPSINDTLFKTKCENEVFVTGEI